MVQFTVIRFALPRTWRLALQPDRKRSRCVERGAMDRNCPPIRYLPIRQPRPHLVRELTVNEPGFFFTGCSHNISKLGCHAQPRPQQPSFVGNHWLSGYIHKFKKRINKTKCLYGPSGYCREKQISQTVILTVLPIHSTCPRRQSQSPYFVNTSLVFIINSSHALNGSRCSSVGTATGYGLAG
jgi:hypothetical protein